MLRPAEPSAHQSPVPPTSEARHTPGPWKWHVGPDGVDLRTPNRGQLIIMAPGRRVGDVRFAQRRELDRGGILRSATEFIKDGSPLRAGFHDIDNPDARLIAAAPGLLAACEALMNTGLICTSGKTTDGRPCNCTCDVHPELLAVIDYARSAIAAAKGGVA